MNERWKRDELPYRQGVIGIIMDDDKNFLIVQMIDYGENQWRFAGGGLDEGEKPEEGLLRELEEELRSRDFEIKKRSTVVNQYEWPDDVVDRQFERKGIRFRGQQQHQFLVMYVGKKQDLSPDPSELRAIKWVSREELPAHFVFENQSELAEKTIADLID